MENLQNNQTACFELINNSQNEIIHDIILSTFENLFNKYFESIPNLEDDEDKEYFPKYFEYIDIHKKVNETYIVFDQSLDIFKKCAYLLEKIYNIKYKKDEEKIENEIICKLYCIAYIKMYLFKFVHFSHYESQKIGNIEPIMKAIKGNANNEVRQIIKIYTFKVFFYIFNNNFQEFENYNYPVHGINIFEDIKEKFVEEKVAMLSYYMIPYGDENTYKTFMEDFEKFDAYRRNMFEKNIKEFKEYIEEKGIDSFYIISTNLITSNLALPNYVINSKEYIKYSSFVKSIFQNIVKIPETTKNLFLLYSNNDSFNDTMKKKLLEEENLKEISTSTFEILLYGLRFCLQTSNCENPEGYLYSQLITKDYEKILKDDCIPGNNILNNRFITGYTMLEKHIKTQPPNCGAYVCSCGYYYAIEPCGFPTEESKCRYCKEKIGYAPLPEGMRGKHGFVHRKGHLRIFKDDEIRQKQFGKDDSSENIPNMLIDEYKKEVIDKILDESKFGINKPKKSIFQQFNHTVRNLSTIGYRLLNFILYSHLFYSNCLGFISNETLQNFLSDEMTCIQTIETDWKLLKDALQSKGIQSIQIFMNLIFKRLSEKIKNCKEITSMEERDKFEEEVEEMLKESYKEYNDYSLKYNEINDEVLKLDKHSMKSVLLENKEYEEKEYPFYKYFLMTTYPSRKSFIDETKRADLFEKNYPLISAYISELNPEKFLIKYLPDFNDFSNYMIDHYSYQVTREYASEKKIKDEDIYKNDENFREKFDSFIQIWENIKEYETKFACKYEMPVIDLSKDKELAYFLNDDGELGKGMYIATAYQNFIEWQNIFLDKLIESLKQSGILHHYVKNIEKTIDVQNAKTNDALDFDDINNMFEEIIYQNSRRNIIREDNSINYMNYKQYVYDFDSIEKILGELLLTGKVRFNGIESLKYVTYCFEGFRGKKSSILSDFINKYTQKPLSVEVKQNIYNIIKDKLTEENDELQKILFSIQLLIYYLIKERQIETDEIKTIIGDLPNYVNLTKECKDFFQNPNLKIKFIELMDVYSYLELLCFNPIIKNLRGYYKKKIEGDQAKKVLALFDDKNFELITKETLAVACRRFISRYLVSTRDDTEYGENKPLSSYLMRYEFWPKDFIQKEAILETDIAKLGEAGLQVGQCFELYNLMNYDEKKALENIMATKKEKKTIKPGGEGRKDNIVKKKDKAKFKKKLMEY